MKNPAYIDVTTATTSELVAFYNEHSGDNPIKKFRDRATAEARVTKLLSERQFNQPKALPDVSAEKQRNVNLYGTANCPHCGVDLDNGVGHHNQEVNGKRLKHKKYEFECLACGKEFGPEIAQTEVNSTGEKRPATVESLKLDRRIMSDVSEEVWPNAYAMWKANPEWMTSSQQDRLTATLYKAAKEGKRHYVTINARTFWLVGYN